MKKLPCTFALIFLVQTLFANHQFTIQQNKRVLSTCYDILTDRRPISRVKKEHLHLNTIYSVRDEMGEYAHGVAKLFSPGTLIKSMREIKLYNEKNKHTGKIKGTVLTTAKGKFTFYDKYKKALARAYIDKSGSSVTIVDATNKWNVYALFRRAFAPEDRECTWEVLVFDEYALDPSTLYIFGAFISDTYWPAIPTEGETLSWESLKLLKIIKD